MVIITRMISHTEGTCFEIPYDSITPIYFHMPPQVPGYGKTQWTHICGYFLHQGLLKRIYELIKS